MLRSLTLYGSMVLILLVAISGYAQDPVGEISLKGGPIFPQGDYARYTDEGGGAIIRLNIHVTEAQPISAFFEIGGNFYRGNETPTVFTGDGIAIPAKKHENEYNFALHLGLQLGTGSRHGFLRPRVSIGPGVYLFNTETAYRPLDYDENLLESNETQVRVGWRGSVGSGFFFSTKWGISFDFIYDHVVNLHRATDADDLGRVGTVSRAGRFQSYMIGVIIPFEHMGN